MHILLINYWFPPINVIGSVRAYQTARFLANKGMEVTVICASDSTFEKNYSVDLSGLNVITIPIPGLVLYLEPSTLILNRLKRATDAFIRRLIYPDEYILISKAIKMATKNIFSSKNPPQIILSSSPPFSMHTMASKLAKENHVPWLADNRDLWAASPYRKNFSWIKVIDAHYEKKILLSAYACIVIGDIMAREMQSSLGPTANIIVVRNGADILPFSNTKERIRISKLEKITLVYTGGLYSGYRDLSPIFEALSMININAEVLFYGSEEDIISVYQKKYPQLSICLQERKSKEKIKEIQRNAHFLLLALGKGFFEKGVLTGKFFEYLETGNPIIAVCDKDSELASLIYRHNLGIATRSPLDIAEYISQSVDEGISQISIPYELTRKSQLDILYEVIKEATNKGLRTN